MELPQWEKTEKEIQQHLERDPNFSEQEDLMVWMRPAALPTFRNMYGWIEEDLKENDTIIVNLFNNYNTYTLGGTKKLVLSPTNFLGGKNNFLGIAYIIVGGLCIFLAMVVFLMHIIKPRFSDCIRCFMLPSYLTTSMRLKSL